MKYHGAILSVGLLSLLALCAPALMSHPLRRFKPGKYTLEIPSQSTYRLGTFLPYSASNAKIQGRSAWLKMCYPASVWEELYQEWRCKE